jgi:Ca2+:H+ antiporter
VVYVVVAIASWYYPNPDVATSNGLRDIISKNATLSVEVLQQIQQLLQQQLQQ